jgi:transcriptional regulator with XRE-family HTH domain
MPPRIGNPSRRRRHFIRDWRLFRNLTQEQLAEMLDSTKTSISRIEDLKQGYTQDFLEACADALGTHPGVLLIRGPTEADREPRESPGASRARKRGETRPTTTE